MLVKTGFVKGRDSLSANIPPVGGMKKIFGTKKLEIYLNLQLSVQHHWKVFYILYIVGNGLPLSHA